MGPLALPSWSVPSCLRGCRLAGGHFPRTRAGAAKDSFLRFGSDWTLSAAMQRVTTHPPTTTHSRPARPVRHSDKLSLYFSKRDCALRPHGASTWGGSWKAVQASKTPVRHANEPQCAWRLSMCVEV